MTLSTRIEPVNELTYIEVVEDTTTVEILEENIVYYLDIIEDNTTLELSEETIINNIEVIEDKTTIEVIEEIVDIIEVAVQGPPGVGMPIGGETGQILAKNSNDNYDFQWMNITTQIMETYDHNSDGKVDAADVADIALDSNLVGGRSITEFYDKTEINLITSRYTYNQPTAMSDWIVTHNLGRFPSGVTVVDSAGSVIEGSIQFINNNSIKISFNYAFSGIAYIG
jgi:Ca2+-binding EF-hand superfamily protein